MSSFKIMTDALTCRHHDQIQKYCQSLFSYFNLFQFYYYRIKFDGSFVLLDSFVPYSEFYESEKLYNIDPTFRHPSFFYNEIVILKDVQNVFLKKILNMGKEKFNLCFFLKLMNRIPDGIEVFGFSSRSNDEAQISFLLSELHLLRLFTKKFREDNPKLFSLVEDNQIDIAKLIGPAFYESSLETKSSSVAKSIFLENMGLRTDLSDREQEVVKFLLNGYSAGKMASKLFLSKRTVEHHIERIKEKLSCFSKAELIQKGRELEHLGYFNLGSAAK